MHREVAFDFGVDTENMGWGVGEPAFRCGLPFGGNGRPIRDGGPRSKLPTNVAAGSQIEVSWPPDVAWRKRIRVSKS
jgi:hypothetical protein